LKDTSSSTGQIFNNNNTTTTTITENWKSKKSKPIMLSHLTYIGKTLVSLRPTHVCLNTRWINMDGTWELLHCSMVTKTFHNDKQLLI